MSRQNPITIDTIKVTPGGINAKVIEKGKRPYEVKLQCRKWDAAEWDKALALLSSEAYYTAALVNGELPTELATRFSSNELNLHIEQERWNSTCTCKQLNEACKHIEAVYYDLVLLLTRDPLNLFVLRGLNKEQLMNRLRSIRSKKFIEHENLEKNTLSIHSDSDSFTASKPLKELSDQNALLGKKLLSNKNDPDFWTKEKTLYQLLRPIYNKVSQQAKEILKGQH